MAIKSRVDGEGATWYLYAECEVEAGAVRSLRWEKESDRHREVTKAKDASNECQMLEVPDSLDDDICPLWDESGASHPERLQVDATDSGQDDPEGNDIMEYDVSEAAGARDAWYMDELRQERDSLLEECRWYAERHRDQTDNSETTSLTGPEYTELLNYRKALRDWPADESDIYARTAPAKPSWM